MRRRLAYGSTGALLVFACLMACGSCGSPRTPAPPFTQHPTSALVEVPYPPPPARVEIMPKPPREDAVWIDGEWVWQGGRWAWRAGRWVVVPPGVAFAPWTTVRASNGTLYFAEGTFRDGHGVSVPEPPPLAAGKARGGTVVDPEGTAVPPSPPATKTPEDAGVEGGAGAPATDGLTAPTIPVGAFVDAGLLPPPEGRSFPDASPSVDGSIVVPKVKDASVTDAMPERPL